MSQDKLNDLWVDALKSNNIDVVKLLVENKIVDPSQEVVFDIVEQTSPNSSVGWTTCTPLSFVASHGYDEIVRILLADPRVNPRVPGNIFSMIVDGITQARYHKVISPLLSMENNHTSVAKLLLEDRRADPATEQNGPIRYASERGYLEIVKLLLSDSRVDPSARNDQAIYYAAKNGHIEIVKLLLNDPRVDPLRDEPNNALQVALQHYHHEVAELIRNWKKTAEKWNPAPAYHINMPVTFDDDVSALSNNDIRFESDDGNFIFRDDGKDLVVSMKEIVSWIKSARNSVRL